jgi:hypothetical protein
MSSNRLKVLLVSLLAVFAVSAVASATASAAAPEFIRCAKVKAGEKSRYKDAGCKNEEIGGGFAKVVAAPGECAKVKAGEQSRWQNAVCTIEEVEGGFTKVVAGKLKFTDKEGVSHLYGTGGVVFTCQKDTSKGEIK